MNTVLTILFAIGIIGPTCWAFAAPWLLTVAIRPWVGEKLHRLADRIDPAGARRLTHWTFTFERGEGVRFREDGRGCRLSYLSDEEYAKAHEEADKPLWIESPAIEEILAAFQAQTERP